MSGYNPDAAPTLRADSPDRMERIVYFGFDFFETSLGPSAAIPEPGALAFLASGVLPLVGMVARRRGG